MVTGLDPKREILGLKEFSAAGERWVAGCAETAGVAGTAIGWAPETGNCIGTAAGCAETAGAAEAI